MRNFTEQELKEVLLFTEDEARLIMKVQRIFPELFCKENFEYVDVLKELYAQLEIETDELFSWIKERISNFDDCVHKQGFSQLKVLVRASSAKNLCMMTETETGQLIRDYYILMREKANGKSSSFGRFIMNSLMKSNSSRGKAFREKCIVLEKVMRIRYEKECKKVATDK